MARLPRLSIPGIPQHIIQRGNNRQICFVSEENFSAYAYWLEEYSNKYQVAIHAWVFMTNHVHMLVTPQSTDGVSKMMQSLGRKYVRYFNSCYKRTGTLWEGRYKSCVVDADEYFLLCQRYIELNPVRAGMVEHPAEYKWSSYHANGLGRRVKLHTPHELYLRLGATLQKRITNYSELCVAQINKSIILDIRKSANKGMALGSESFKMRVEDLTGRRVSELKTGPKPNP